MSNNCNIASGHARHLILVSNPRFLGMGNHLGLFSGSSDQPEGQELGGGAVGGQEGLQEVKFFTWGVTQLLSMLEKWFWCQNVLGYGESFRAIFRYLRPTLRPRTWCRCCRRSRRTSRSEILTSRVSQLLKMLETWLWWQHQCFGV